MTNLETSVLISFHNSVGRTKKKRDIGEDADNENIGENDAGGDRKRGDKGLRRGDSETCFGHRPSPDVIEVNISANLDTQVSSSFFKG